MQGRINPAIILGLPAVENHYPVSFVYVRNARLCASIFENGSNLLMRGN